MFKNKYLKYKIKYLKLKYLLYGGTNMPNSEDGAVEDQDKMPKNGDVDEEPYTPPYSEEGEKEELPQKMDSPVSEEDPNNSNDDS